MFGGAFAHNITKCKNLGGYLTIQVADDPETLRIKQNSKIISNVAYHGDLEKKAAMEKQREVAEVADNRGESMDQP